MTCPSLEEPVDIEAQILAEGRSDPTGCHIIPWWLIEQKNGNAQTNHLSEQYSQSSYHSYDASWTCSQFLTNCFALRFSSLSFLYNTGDAEHISKATICRAVRNLTLALKRLLYTFLFPRHRKKVNFHLCIDLVTCFKLINAEVKSVCKNLLFLWKWIFGGFDSLDHKTDKASGVRVAFYLCSQVTGP